MKFRKHSIDESVPSSYKKMTNKDSNPKLGRSTNDLSTKRNTRNTFSGGLVRFYNRFPTTTEVSESIYTANECCKDFGHSSSDECQNLSKLIMTAVKLLLI